MIEFTGWDLALAAWVGFVAGVNDPPWLWETWAVMGIFILYIALRITASSRGSDD